MCGEHKQKMDTHHIHPQRLGGPDSIYNEILLCHDCHSSINGKELLYKDIFYKKINGKLIRTDCAQHVMQGKYYLRNDAYHDESIRFSFRFLP